jgi:dihydropteroate synthase
MTLRLGRHEFTDDTTLMMAIVNRTPDSFYDRGATWDEGRAHERVAAVVAQGAEIVDIGGIKAAPGTQIGPEEEKARVVDFVAQVRASYPDLVISVDTWRAEVGRAVCEAGADVLNDAWGGADPELVDVAAQFGAGLVCTHTGGATPRTRPFRIEYDDVVVAAITDTVAYAERAVAAGVARESVVIDPAHDFGKNTFHSLEITRADCTWSRRAGRCWCRCPTRTSSARPSTSPSASASRGLSRPPRSARWPVPGSTASTR